MQNIEHYLAQHDFETLFIENLGWDRFRSTVVIDVRDRSCTLQAVAQKRGFVVFACQTERALLADRQLLRELQRKLSKSYHEHILIHFCELPRKQVWQWVIRAADTKQLCHREHPFFSNRPPPNLIERIQKLNISLADEDQTNLIDVLARVRTVLLPESEFDLFARRPWYAKKSDELAMAIKRGEPGAFGTFVEFHMPLARKSSRSITRWFAIDPEDAEQIAMIGLLEAARRFEPERGAQFSTYASYWIRQMCQRYGLECGLSIHVPTHVFWPCYKIQFVEAELAATYGEQEAKVRLVDELERAGITDEQWKNFGVARHLELFCDVDKHTLTDIDTDHDVRSISTDVSDQESRSRIRECIESLKPRQAQILRMRYGFDQPEMTLQEIAKTMGITRERVRQIQFKAEKKLTRMLRLNGFQDEPLSAKHEMPEIQTDQLPI